MSVQCAVTCVACRVQAPPVGDGGYFGYPSLVPEPRSPHAEYAEIPTFGYVYEPFKAIHLRPYGLESFAEFLSRHQGHPVFLTSDHDPSLPPAIEELYGSEEFVRSAVEEETRYQSERESRRESGEFVNAFYQLRCSCGAFLAPREPDLLMAFAPTTLEPGAVRLFLERDRAPDDGWNHRIVSFWDPYGRFMEALPGFLRRHGPHAIEISLRPATEVDAEAFGEIEIQDVETEDGALDDEDFAEEERVPAPVIDAAFETLDVAIVAELYRAFIVLVGLSAAVGLAGRVVSLTGHVYGIPSLEIAGFALTIALLLIAIRMVVVGYQLARDLEFRWPWLWAAGLCLPVFAVIPLLALSANASAYFRSRGIHVGLLGPSRSSIGAYAKGFDAQLSLKNQ